MTKQKFYEYLVVKTFELKTYEDDETLAEKLGRLGYHEGMTFNEIVMKWSLLGGNSIPKKENFKEWGIPYVCQLLGFVERVDNPELTREYFSFLRKNRKLYKNDEWAKFGDLCWDVMFNNIMRNRSFAEEISSFILFEFKDADWFQDYFKTAYALSIFNIDAVDEAFRVRCGESLSDMVKETIENENKSNSKV